MSSDVIARLETLLNRVVARRALPRTAAPVEVPVLATSPAPKYKYAFKDARRSSGTRKYLPHAFI